MDHGTFDRLTLQLSRLVSRRATVGGLGVLALPGLVDAKKKRRKKKRKKKCGKAGRKPVKGKCCTRSVNIEGTCQPCDVCASGCDFSSVQAAIDAADPGATIAICPGTYREDLTINSVLTLVGAGDGEGSGDTILQGTGQNSVVTISGVVTLERLRITGGDSGNAAGGGLRNEGTTQLISCTVSGNTAGSDGGGIYHLAGTLTLTDCTVSGNTAGFRGGGIASRDMLIVTRSKISGNTAYDGGGIFNIGGNLSLVDSEISGNIAKASGGGIVNFSPSGNLSLVDSEVSGNRAGSNGGGIATYDGTVSLDATSRVTENTANSSGGIHNNLGTVTLASSEIVSGNTPNNCAGPTAVAQCSG